MIPYSNFFVDNYHTYYDDIADRNLKVLRLLSVLGLIVGLPLCSISLFIEHFLKATEVYALLVFASVLLNVLTRTFLNTHRRYIPAAFYVSYTVIMAAAIYLGTVSEPEMNAVTFIVFLVILPLFIVDIPSRICLFMGISCLIFCIAARQFKTPDIASYDIINTIIFYLVSICTSHHSNYLNIRQIMSNNILEIQRDTDKMTGLWNRGFCERKIISFLNTANSYGALLIIDVDNFKQINDSKGHDCGDSVLKSIASALRQAFRSTDIIGRIGGDEFIVFLPGCINSDILKQRICTFLEGVSSINSSVNEEFPSISASVGVSMFPEDGKSFQDLFKHADEALYLSKENGKNQYAFYHVLH